MKNDNCDQDLYKIKYKKVIKQRRILVIYIIVSSILNFLIYFSHSTVQNLIKLLKNKGQVLIEYTYTSIHTAYYWVISLDYNSFFSQFNNREKALTIWTIIILIFLLAKHRNLLWKMIKILCCKKFMVWYATMFTYTFFIVYILYFIGFWEWFLLKSTIMWFVFTGVISALNSVDKIRQKQYLKNMIIDNLKFILIFQFIVNLYPFSLMVELLLIPLITFSFLISAIIESIPQYHTDENKRVKNFFDNINGLLGIYILIKSIEQIYINYNTINFINTFKDFLLPAILSLLFLIYIYISSKIIYILKEINLLHPLIS